MATPTRRRMGWEEVAAMFLRRVIRWTVILVIALHGLLHLLGVV